MLCEQDPAKLHELIKEINDLLEAKESPPERHPAKDVTCYPTCPFPPCEGHMIQSTPEDIEQIRERIRKMSDAELRKYGRAARDLSDSKKNYGKPNPSFKIQLDEARAEWRRRHPRQPPKEGQEQ